MAARILDGTKLAGEIRAEVAAQVKALALSGVRPGLAVVLVGHNPASEVYVRGKVKSCEEVGLYSEQHTPAESATTEELLALIAALNWPRRNRRHPGAVAACPRTSMPKKFCWPSIPPKMLTDSIP